MSRTQSFDPYGNSFVGREPELAFLADLFNTQHALITIVGAPGIGKTRLALRFGERLGEQESSVNCYFVDLSHARSASDVQQLIFAATAVESSTEFSTSIGEHRCLVVLDNFEQVVDRAAGALSALMRRAPRATFIVTSREPLRITGERVLTLDALALPQHGCSPDDVFASEAGQLFVDRAHEAMCAKEDAPHIATIVRRLDGIPLAIQLAASRLRVLSPAQLALRLDHTLELLTATDRDQALRHTTLRAAIDWSWSLLTANEQAALSHVSVFRGSFPIEAAESVVALGDTQTTVLDVLQGLSEKSLLRTLRATENAEVRFALYASIREFANDKLQASPDRQGVLMRYGAYYAHITQQIGHHLGARGLSLARQLALELDNLLGAFEGLLEYPQKLRRGVSKAVRNVHALLDIVSGRGRADGFNHARIAADEVAEAAQALSDATDDNIATDPRLRAAMYNFIATTYGVFGRPDNSRPYFERALHASRDANARIRARILTGYGALHRAEHRWQESRSCLDEALALARTQNDRGLEIEALAELGHLQLRQQEPAQALAAYERARDFAQQCGDGVTEARLLSNVAVSQQELGRFADAEHSLQAAIALHRARGDTLREAGTRGYLGGLYHEQDRRDEAEACYRSALDDLRSSGGRRTECMVQLWLGSLLARNDRVDEATACFEAAAALCRAIGDLLLYTQLTIHRASLELARSRQATRIGDTESAGEHRTRALAFLDGDAELSDGVAHRPPAESTADLGGDVRFAQRLLQAEISQGAYVVARDGSWFQTPSTAQVDLRQRKRLHRLFAALVAHYDERPRDALSLDMLIQKGWPQERMDSHSAINRLHVALTTLRNLGLRDLILRDDKGYRLDASKPLMLA